MSCCIDGVVSDKISKTCQRLSESQDFKISRCRANSFREFHVFWRMFFGFRFFFLGGIFSKSLCDVNWWILKTNLVFNEMCQIGEQDKIGNRCRARKCRVCPQSIPQLHCRLPQQASTGTRGTSTTDTCDMYLEHVESYLIDCTEIQVARCSKKPSQNHQNQTRSTKITYFHDLKTHNPISQKAPVSRHVWPLLATR